MEELVPVTGEAEAKCDTHGFHPGQIVFWHVQESYFGMRGTVIDSSDYYQTPCLLVRFGRHYYHTHCSHLASTDPKLTKKARRSHKTECEKQPPGQECAHRRRTRRNRRRHASTPMDGLLCGLCGDAITGTPCCVAGEVCQLFSTPCHFGCLQHFRPNTPWERYAFPDMDHSDITRASPIASSKEENNIPSVPLPAPSNHRHRKPPKFCADAWSPMMHRLGSAAKKKSRSLGFPSARSWRCTARPRCGRTSWSGRGSVGAHRQVLQHVSCSRAEELQELQHDIGRHQGRAERLSRSSGKQFTSLLS